MTQRVGPASSSSSPSPPTSTPEPHPARAAATPPAPTETRSAPSTHRTPPANDHDLCFGPRPPRHPLESTQPEIIKRWPPHIRNRLAARPRTPAVVLESVSRDRPSARYRGGITGICRRLVRSHSVRDRRPLEPFRVGMHLPARRRAGSRVVDYAEEFAESIDADWNLQGEVS